MLGSVGKISYVFASSNTSQGFFTFIPDLLKGLGKVVVVKDGAGSGESVFIRMLGESWAEQGYETEFWLSAAEPVNPDGVYIPQLNTAIVNGNLPIPIDFQHLDLTTEMVDLSDCVDKIKLARYSNQFIAFCDEIEHHKKQADMLLAQAGRIKRQIGLSAAARLNQDRLEQLITGLSREIERERPLEKHYFGSAVTADGVINYIDELSKDCRKRYIFKGPLGSGKSEVIAGIAGIAAENGALLRYYYCGFRREQLLMVVISDLNIALIDDEDSKIFPRPWDKIIDMTDYMEESDSELEAESAELKFIWLKVWRKALEELEHTYKLNNELKKAYMTVMNFEELNRKKMLIKQEITDAMLV